MKRGGGNTNLLELLLLEILPLSYHHSHFWPSTLDFTTFFHSVFFCMGRTFFTAWLLLCRFLFFSFFLHKHKNCSNSGMHASIELKFGTRVEQHKANKGTKFGDNPTRILVVISDISCKQRSIC